MPVYVSTTFAPDGSSVFEAAKTLGELGISNVELGSTHCEESELREKLLSLEGVSYLTHNFFPPSNSGLVLNLAAQNRSARQESLDFAKAAIDFAISIGAAIYTVHPGFLVQPLSEGKTKNKESRSFDFEFPELSGEDLYEPCMKAFLGAVNELQIYIQGKPIRLAIESQGSFSKKEYVVFSKPEDFSRFMAEIPGPQTGINLNLAHLALASKAWGYCREEFIDQIKHRVLAIEVSHHGEERDNHESLVPGAWYLESLKKHANSFREIPVVFEGRHISHSQIRSSCQLLQESLR